MYYLWILVQLILLFVRLKYLKTHKSDYGKTYNFRYYSTIIVLSLGMLFMTLGHFNII